MEITTTACDGKGAAGHSWEKGVLVIEEDTIVSLEIDGEQIQRLNSMRSKLYLTATACKFKIWHLPFAKAASLSSPGRTAGIPWRSFSVPTKLPGAQGNSIVDRNAGVVRDGGDFMRTERNIKPVLEKVQDQLKVRVYDQREAMGGGADIREASACWPRKSAFASSLRPPRPRMSAWRR